MVTTEQVLSRLNGYPRNLTWVSFRKVMQSLQPPLQASTSSSYSSVKYTTRLIDGTYRPFFTTRYIVEVRLNARDTWVVNQQAVQTGSLLQHEQGHFDITGLIARDLCRDLLSIEIDREILAISKDLPRNPTPNDLLRAAHNYIRTEVDKYGQEAQALLARLQTHRENGTNVDGLYDIETGHGQTLLGQQKWNEIFRHARQTDTRLSLTIAL
ncbi:MAG: hypothetical protein HS132_14615 [Planctomycetia bacterium]|nr:hypothetical protein [Planctomycetia bacterium]